MSGDRECQSDLKAVLSAIGLANQYLVDACAPGLTAVVGTIVVFCIFAGFTGQAGVLTLPMTRNYLEIGAEIGIIAAPVHS